MLECDKGLYNKYQIINRETGREEEGDYFVLKPVKDPAARAALLEYAKTTNNEQLAMDIVFWVTSIIGSMEECDWCGELATELSYPHMFDPAIGKRMCCNCWEHDREVYKGSYGEDIGEFKAIGGTKSEET